MKLISRTPPSIKPHINEKIGMLLLKASYYCPDNKRYYVECLCDCGINKIIRFDGIKSGTVVSCGCYSKKMAKKHLTELRTSHGMSHTSIYNRWINIRNRCNNQNDNNYHFYGGRGIRVCKKWDESFEAFYKDIGDIPSGQTIDRIDNNSHYSCGNCNECKSRGWKFNVQLVPMTRQNRNRRSNIKLTMNGKTMVLQDWAKEIGINPSTVRTRINRGWDIKDALLTPARAVNQTWRDSD